MTQLKDITCPRCGQPNTWHTNNPFRPFCSERCKLIDLGDWAAEKHSIPGDPTVPDKEDDETDHS